jgi:hypothetical protein
MDKTKHKFNSRAFVCIMIGITGFSLPITGLLFHAEQGGPRFHGGFWQPVHVAMGILFTIFCTWHIILNRKALLRYLTALDLRRLRISRELGLALVICGTILLISIIHGHIHLL